MIDIVDRLKFDSARCEATFSKGVATNIDEAVSEIVRLRAALESLTKDPPSSLAREPDADHEVIIKMRKIASDALAFPNGDRA
jgi:hypothetical protein